MLAILKQFPLVPVFYHDDKTVCCNVLAACAAAGITAFEFTNRGDNASENFKALKEMIAANNWNIALGAGTIKTTEQANNFIQAGARFIVSPFGSAAIADVCNQANIPYLPGCMTITEVANAIAWGCPLVKIFPGEVLGPKFIKALKAPLPEAQVMVTGGVDGNNIQEWFAAGVTAVGIGSQFFSKELIAAGNYELIAKNIREACIKAKA